MLAVLAANPQSPDQIWIRAFDSLQARPVPGTESADPRFAWSPDSRFLVFRANGQLKKLEIASGLIQALTPLSNRLTGLALNNSMVLYATFGGTSVMRIPLNGGTPVQVPGIAGGPMSLQLLDDGKHFLYARATPASSEFRVYPRSLEQPPSPQASPALPLLHADSHQFQYVSPPTGSRSGLLLFLRQSQLMAQRFNAERLALDGEAFLVKDRVSSFTVSAQGTLVYRAGETDGANTQLTWYDRQGKQTGVVGPPASNADVQLSPDGKRVVVDRAGVVTHLWVAEVSRGLFSRLIPGEALDMAPAISPDGRVAFTHSPESGIAGDVYAVPAGGAGSPEAWAKSANVKHPNGFSPDGRYLIYDEHTPNHRQDLWIVAADAPAGGVRKPVPFLTTDADETFGQFSPNGKWIAYRSTESGRPEVFVRDFAPDRVPAAGPGKWLISTDGGDKPRWRHDGKELFYIAGDGALMAVPLRITPEFQPGIAVPLFKTRAAGYFPYDVSPDGRFLVNTIVGEADERATPITVVLNWMSGLKQ